MWCQSAERVKSQRRFVAGNTVLAFNPPTYIEVPVIALLDVVRYCVFNVQ